MDAIWNFVKRIDDPLWFVRSCENGTSPFIYSHKDVSERTITNKKYQEGYEKGFEEGCKVGSKMAADAAKMQQEFEQLMGDDDPKDKLLRVMAEYILSGVPFECETCTNPIRNMGWEAKYKGCDGECRHDKGIPQTQEEVIAYFKELV